MAGNVADSKENDLTPKQEALIVALLAHHSITAAARIVGISDRTAHRWMKMPYFQAALKEAQNRQFDETLRALQSGVSAAIKTLLQAMTDPEVRPYVRVQAASKWLDLAIELHKMSEIEQKFIQIEMLMKEEVS